MFWHIHANDYVQLSAVSYIINCLCHVDQNVLYWFCVEQSYPSKLIFYTSLLDFFVNVSWTDELLSGKSWFSLMRENVWSIRSTNEQPVLENSSQVHLMNLELAGIFRQSTTQCYNFWQWKNNKEMKQGQQPGRRRRGVRLRGGRVGRQNRGRGRRGQGHVPEEIRVTIVDHVLNHGLTMAEAGWKVQPDVGRATVSSNVL